MNNKNKKLIKKQLNFLQALFTISLFLFISTVCAIWISFGNQFHNFIDLLSFIGIGLMVGFFATIPIGAIIWFIYGLKFNENDIYETAWKDGVLDAQTYTKEEIDKIEKDLFKERLTNHK